MSQYGILHPEFFGGETGRKIAELGGASAQVLALYLTANKDATMIGLYPIELAVVRARIITLSTPGMVKALGALSAAEFADFDAGTNHVWVREMAKFRLNLQDGALDRDDNRVKGVNRMYHALKPNPFLRPFFDRYVKDLHLTRCRDFQGVAKALQAPCKPVINNRDQKDQERRSRSTASAPIEAAR